MAILILFTSESGRVGGVAGESLSVLLRSALFHFVSLCFGFFSLPLHFFHNLHFSLNFSKILGVWLLGRASVALPGLVGWFPDGFREVGGCFVGKRTSETIFERSTVFSVFHSSALPNNAGDT